MVGMGRRVALAWVLMMVASVAGGTESPSRRVSASCMTADSAVGTVPPAGYAAGPVDATADGGGAWAAWLVAGKDSSAIWLQAFDGTGVPQGPASVVSTTHQPSSLGVPCLAGGGTAPCIVYEETTGSTSDMWLGLLPAAGVPLPAPHSLGATASVYRPRVPRAVGVEAGATHPGRYGIVWTDWSGALPVIMGVWCDTLGIPLAPPSVWRAGATGSSAPAGAPWGADSIAVVWVEGSWPGRVVIAYLAVGATLLVPAFDVSLTTFATRRVAPRVAVRDRLAACVWDEAVDGITRAVCRWSDVAGPRGSVVSLDGATAFHELSPAVSIPQPGLALCAWERGQADSTRAWARWILASGVATDGAFDLSQGAPTWRRQPALCPLPDGNALALWTERVDSLPPDVFRVAARTQCPLNGWTAVGGGVQDGGSRPVSPALVCRQGRDGWRVEYSGNRMIRLRALDCRGRALGDAVNAFPGESIPLSAFRLAGRGLAFVCADAGAPACRIPPVASLRNRAAP